MFYDDTLCHHERQSSIRGSDEQNERRAKITRIKNYHCKMKVRTKDDEPERIQKTKHTDLKTTRYQRAHN